MAAANNGPRVTRSRKKTIPDDPTEKPAYSPQPRSLRSSKNASTRIVFKNNCAVVIRKLQLENAEKTEKAERQSPARKRTRVDNGDVSRDENDSENKVCLLFCWVRSLSKRVATICRSSFDNNFSFV